MKKLSLVVTIVTALALTTTAFGVAFASPVVSSGPTAAEITCAGNESAGPHVLRSTNHGSTWMSLGTACVQDFQGMATADSTPLVVDGRIVLYFVNFMALDKGILYRISSADGVHFDKPQSAYVHGRLIMDPFVLRMPDGSFRMYATSDPEGTLTAVSSDGLNFTKQGGIRGDNGVEIGLRFGGMMGALVTPENKVRLFLDGGPNSQGIVSLISDDGVRFTEESGFRIPLPPNYLYINNPEPIRLTDGSYLMLYQTQGKKHEGREDWEAEIHLAASKDGFTWVTDPKIIVYGGTSCVVEAPDGTLFIYY